MKDLPAFKARPPDAVRDYAARVFIRHEPGHVGDTTLLDLIAYPDGHYRACFDPAYFTLAEGRQSPSKSQWSTLKKKMKRHDRGVFVFKAHGETTIPGGRPCYYVDFGFFAA